MRNPRPAVRGAGIAGVVAGLGMACAGLFVPGATVVRAASTPSPVPHGISATATATATVRPNRPTPTPTPAITGGVEGVVSTPTPSTGAEVPVGAGIVITVCGAGLLVAGRRRP